MESIRYIMELNEIENIIYILKTFFISMCTYYTYLRLLNNKNFITKNSMKIFIFTIIVSILCSIIKYYSDSFTATLVLIFLLSSMYSIIHKSNIGYTILYSIISLSITYILFSIAIIISFIINLIVILKNDYINLFVMMATHIILLYFLFKIRRFKNGLKFLNQNIDNSYFDILILNISCTILFIFIISNNTNILLIKKLFVGLIIVSTFMFITIQKTLTMYYKHKMLIKDLNETKDELDKKIKEVEKLEQENIEISKKSHSVSHKIKSLNRKIDKLMMNNEIGDEIDIKDRIKEITNKYYKDKVVVELSKTGIEIVDDMLDYMKNECIKSGIDFELQLNGNIHYMTNNFVSKEELEILLADHIKDAIIAIKHSDNVNRSILVRLGMIDEFYSLYIYDSGIEFEIDTLINLGIKPVTTHADEDGTGMGFLNTFDTLKKHNASLIINEIGKPGKDNYTKVIMIKFDGKGEFKINSYRAESIKEQDNNNRLQIDIK